MNDSTSTEAQSQALKARLAILPSSAVVGVDIAKRKHFACILDPQGQTIQAPFSFGNDEGGFAQLMDRVTDLGHRFLINDWVFGFEASGGYEKTLAAFLVEQGFDVVQVDSFVAKRQRELMTGSVDKNDAKDCVAIAFLVRQGFVKYYHLRGLKEESLVGLVQLNEHLKKRRTQLKLKIKGNVLKYTFPELERFCKDVSSRFSMELLTLFPTPHDIVQVGKLEFKKTMLPRLRSRRIAFYLDEVYTLAEHSIGLKADRWTTKALELRTYIAELRTIEQQRVAVVKRLKGSLETNEDYQLICTIPGVGLETGSALLAEIGDINRFSTDRQLISFAGLDLVSYQSGEYSGPPRVSKRGRPLIRKVAYQAVNAALLARKPNILNRRYREIIAKQGNSKEVRQKAKVKLSAKLLRIVFAVLTKQEPYREHPTDQAA
jgi:transposase